MNAESSPDLSHQLRTYVDRVAPPITFGEVTSPAVHETVVRPFDVAPTRARRARLGLVAAAAFAALLIGVLAMRPPGTTDVVQTPATVQQISQPMPIVFDPSLASLATATSEGPIPARDQRLALVRSATQSFSSPLIALSVRKSALPWQAEMQPGERGVTIGAHQGFIEQIGVGVLAMRYVAADQQVFGLVAWGLGDAEATSLLASVTTGPDGSILVSNPPPGMVVIQGGDAIDVLWRSASYALSPGSLPVSLGWALDDKGLLDEIQLFFLVQNQMGPIEPIVVHGHAGLLRTNSTETTPRNERNQQYDVLWFETDTRTIGMLHGNFVSRADLMATLDKITRTDMAGWNELTLRCPTGTVPSGTLAGIAPTGTTPC